MLPTDHDQSLKGTINRYTSTLQTALSNANWDSINDLAETLEDCWKTGRRLFVCGNGGSGANAIHIENDFLYGISKTRGSGLRCKALTANQSVITCLANDEGYEKIFSYQVAVHAQPGDVLLVLSGSGNSANIVKVIEEAKRLDLVTFGILGYDGGKAKSLVDTAIHFPVDDMQICEDLQMMVAHIISQWLYTRRGLQD
jgi:D-sedoheptulose 7-phosphate isomerase